MAGNFSQFRPASTQKCAHMTLPKPLSLLSTIFIKDTSGRICLALTRAFLVRWLLVLAIAPLLMSGAARAQAMPRDNQNRPAPYIDVQDETGRTIRIPQPVRRIVSLAPSVTETLFALGVGDRVVGDTDFCDYPPEAKQKTRIGGPVSPSLEAIAALHPDLVVATREINRLDTVHALEQLGIAVYATYPLTVEQVLTSTERLGEILGAGETAHMLTANLRRRLSEVDRRLSGLPPKSVLMIVWLDPLMSVGRDTFLDDALRRAGAHSVIDSPQDWPTVDLEQVVHLQPDYLIISNDNARQVQRELSQLQERTVWRRLEAVRNRHFIVLSEAMSHPSPRLVDGIEQLARALYPSAFAAEAALPGTLSSIRSRFVPCSPLLLPFPQTGRCL
jgi:cobalamin transport system substrate-binding protein